MTESNDLLWLAVLMALAAVLVLGCSVLVNIKGDDSPRGDQRAYLTFVITGATVLGLLVGFFAALGEPSNHWVWLAVVVMTIVSAGLLVLATPRKPR
jgi:drug/metabolite transporter (DMT)-like permease